MIKMHRFLFSAVALIFVYSSVSIENCKGIPVFSRSDEKNLTNFKDLTEENNNTELTSLENYSKHHISKRGAPIFSDSDYGSRLTAGSNLVQDRIAWHNVFGRGGPGKRSFPRTIVPTTQADSGLGLRIDGLHGEDISRDMYRYMLQKLRLAPDGGLDLRVSDSDSNYNNGEIVVVQSPQKRRLMTDGGYGSRIDAANKLAVDLSMVDYVFGRLGPGKR